MKPFICMLVAATAAFLAGGIWYAPKVFGDRWKKLAGVPAEAASMLSVLLKGAALTLLSAVVLFFFLRALNVHGAGEGALYGFTAGLGFAASASAMCSNYENRPRAMIAINVGHFLLAYTIMGLVIGLFYASDY